jgi:hypothetical protein
MGGDPGKEGPALVAYDRLADADKLAAGKWRHRFERKR